jgi:hypothetical protein
MATVNSGTVPADRVVTIGDFVERVHLPWAAEHKRPSTAKGYRDIWEDHLKPISDQVWLKDTRTYHVQSWLNQIGAGKLSRNTLKHVKSVISGISTLAKQQDYFPGREPRPAILRTTQRPRSHKKRMPTHWKRFRRFSPCSPSPQPQPSRLLRSWGYGTAKYRAYCGRTTATGNFTFLALSGMAASQTQRLARVAHLFQCFDNLRSGWKCCVQGIR